MRRGLLFGMAMSPPASPPPALGPYRSNEPPSRPPPAIGRWVPVLVGGVLSVAAALLLFAPREDAPPQLAVFDLPAGLADGAVEFPGEEVPLREAVPLAPLLQADQPEEFTLLSPSEGITRIVRGNALIVRFNRPVVRASEVGRPLSRLPILLEPVSGNARVSGTATWASRNTLSFLPDPAAFDANLEFRLRIPEGFTSLDGEPLYVDEDVERIVVLDGHPRLLRHDARVSAGEPLALYFSARVDPAELARSILVYEGNGGARAIPFVLRPRGSIEDLFRVDVVPTRPLAPGSRVGLAIAPVFSTWRGSVPAFYDFFVQARPRFVGLGCTISEHGTAGCAYTESPGEVIDIEADLVLLASHPIADVAVSSVVVRPALRQMTVSVAGEAAERRRHLVIQGEWEPDQVYEVRVGTVVTESGERVSPPGPLAVRSAGHAPEVRVAEGFHTFEQGAPFILPFSGIHLDGAELRVRPVEAGDEFYAVFSPTAFVAGSSARVTPLGALAPDARPNRWGRGEIPLVGEASRNVLAVGLTATGSTEPAQLRTVLVQRTDLGVSAIARRDGLDVWVTSVRTARPVSGAEVAFVTRSSEHRAAARTDARGLARIDLGSDAALDGTGVVVVATADDRALLVLDPRRAVGPAQLGVSSGAEERATDLGATVVADRGIYRPGETVRAAAFVRRVRSGVASLPGALPVALRVWDPTGEIPYATIDGAVDDRGGFDAALELPDPAPTGTWRLELVARDADRTKLGETVIEVDEYREPRLRVEIERAPGASADGLPRAGERLRATLAARYLFGSPVSRGRVSWSVTRLGPAPMPARWSDMTFGPAGQRVRYQVLAEETTELGADGTVAIETLLELNVARRARFSIAADVVDVSGEGAATESTFVVYPAAPEIGMRTGPDWVSLGETLAAELVAIDPAGEPLVGVPIEVRFEREGWHGWWEWHGREDDGAFQMRRAQHAETVARCRITSAIELVRCEHTPERPGTYHLVATTRGGSVTSRRVYVAGPDDSPDRDPPGAPIALTAERDEYEVGEIARLAFESPWPSARALIAVVDGGVVHHEVREVAAGGQIVEVPLTDAMVPNAHVVLALVRPRTAEPSAQSDLGAPDLRFGATALRVRPRTARLEVTIEQEGEEVRAGSRVPVAVRVRDAEGRPRAGAHVVVWAVDEGTLRITGYQVPSPVRGWFPRRPARFALEDLRRTLVSRLPGALETLPTGDGGYEESASDLASRERYEPTVLWEPRLRTDADGRVVTEIALPERLTEYRIMAIAVDEGSGGGTASSRLVATQPLVARFALPRFVTDGDEPSAGYVVTNRTGETAPVRAVLSWTADDGVEREVGTSSFELGPGEERTVRHLLRIEGTRSARFVLRIEGRDGVFETQREIAVVPRGYFVRRSVLVGGTGERAITVEFPEGVSVGRLRASVATHPFLHGDALVDRAREAWWRSTSADAGLVLAAAANARLATRVGSQGFAARERDAAVAAALLRLQGTQLSSGGFPRFSGEVEDARATVLAAFALVEASRENAPPIAPGLVVSPQARERAIERVAQIVRSGELRYDGREVFEDQALALRLLASVGRGDERARSAAFGRRQFASALELAHLAASYGPRDAERATLALEAARRILEPRSDDAHATTDLVAIAAACEAAATTSPARGLVRALLARLLERQGSASFDDVPWVLRAEAAVAEGLGRLRSGETSLLLDGSSLEPVARGPALARFELPFAQLAAARRVLVASAAPETPVFLALDGEWAMPLTPAESVARGNGVSLHRVLENEAGTPLADGAHVPLGALVRVRLFVYAEHESEVPVVVRDPHAAGFEPVQAGHRTSPSQALAALLGSSPTDEFADARGALALRTAPRVAHVEHDVHASSFALVRLGGLSELTYGVRATTPGTFTIPPAELASARRAELVARSAASTLVVDP